MAVVAPVESAEPEATMTLVESAESARVFVAEMVAEAPHHSSAAAGAVLGVKQTAPIDHTAAVVFDHRLTGTQSYFLVAYCLC